MNTFQLQTNARTDFVNITKQVQECIRTSGMRNGVVTAFIPHTTAGITINENADPDVVDDMIKVLDKLIPWSDGYRHAEGNTAAHIKATLTGSSIQIPVQDGILQLGTWQGIYFCEFDGPRTRSVWVQESE